MCHSAECLHAMQHRPVPQPHGGQYHCPQFAGRGLERSCPGSYNWQVDGGWSLFDFKAVLNHCPYLLNDYICMMLYLKCPLHTSLSYILGPNWKWLEFILLYIFIKFSRKFLIPFSTSGCDLALDICKSIWRWFDVINKAHVHKVYGLLGIPRNAHTCPGGHGWVFRTGMPTERQHKRVAFTSLL